jgi:2-polyprenyl-3-methyl-5-hydroxy-6-metoxy-1,4-benzoquinol methylase
MTPGITDPTWPYGHDPRPDIQRLVDPDGRRILDAGCGTGALASALKAAGAGQVAGIESHPDAARRAREELDVLVEGDLLEIELPFGAGEFDYLIFADVLEHLADPDRALDRLLPLLKDGGRVIVSVPNMRFYLVLLRLALNRWSYTDTGVRDRTHLRIFTRPSLEEMLSAHGLAIERMERNYRVFEDQSQMGRVGALATRVARRTIAPLFPDLFAYQFIAMARLDPRAQPGAGGA